MKHLRKYNESFNKDEYYITCTWDDWANTSSIKIEKKYVDFLLHYPNIKFKLYENEQSYYVVSENVYIYQTEDEYFMCRIDCPVDVSLDKYHFVDVNQINLYKCDQFEGLLELLVDKMYLIKK